MLRPRETGESVEVDDDWFVRRDGSMVPVAYSSAPFDTPDGRGAVVVFRDTTERRSRRRIVEAADAERRRLGRDLHDGAQQRLVNVVIALQMALEAGTRSSPRRWRRRGRRSRTSASSAPGCTRRS